MNEKLAFANRLNQALDEAKIPPLHKGRQQVLCKLFDVSQQAARKWLSGEALPATKRLPLIAQRLGISGEWLLTGKGVMRLPQDIHFATGQYTFVSRYQANNSNAANDDLAFRTAWLQQMGLHADALVAIWVDGDNMLPRIQHNDVLLVDTGQRSIENQKLYALRYGEAVRIKRLVYRYDQSLILRNDNPDPAYKDEVVPPSEIQCLDLVGRVVWVGGVT